MLVKHVKVYENGRYIPVATIVALNPKQIGVSVCSARDSFNKKMGVQIATGRAKKNAPYAPPNRFASFLCNKKILFKSFEAALYDECERMQERAHRYYKDFQYEDVLNMSNEDFSRLVRTTFPESKNVFINYEDD